MRVGKKEPPAQDHILVKVDEAENRYSYFETRSQAVVQLQYTGRYEWRTPDGTVHRSPESALVQHRRAWRLVPGDYSAASGKVDVRKDRIVVETAEGAITIHLEK